MIKAESRTFPGLNFRDFARHVIALIEGASRIAKVSVFLPPTNPRVYRAKIFITERARVNQTRKNLRILKSSEKLPAREVRASRVLHNRIISRQYGSSSLSHVDADGKAKMVDVGDKNVTNRRAEARGFVVVGPEVSELIRDNNMKKGDVLVVAQLAGIMAAKRTTELIPLCHPLSLSCVNVQLKLDPVLHRVEITSEVRCTGKTGVEMEALTAVSVAALTVYDMCKAVAPPSVLRISGIEVVSKSGGRSGDFFRKEIDNVT